MKMYDQKRQHPVMIPLGAFKSLFYLLVPLFIIMIQSFVERDFLRGLFIFSLGGAAILVVLIIYQVLTWAFYTYRYEAGYLHVKSGIIFKKERSIKRERVQTVNIRTGIVQRLLGLASLQVETAGGGEESELSLTAVTLEEAYKIKRSLERPEDLSSAEQAESVENDWSADESVAESDKNTAAASSKTFSGIAEEIAWRVAGTTTGAENSDLEEGEIYRIRIPELFLAGATSGGFLVLFSVIGVIFSQVIPFIPETFWDYLLEQVTSTAAGTVVLVVLFLLLLSWLISSVAYMVQYANFTLWRRGDRLQVSWGLIEQKQLALNLNRLQALVIHEGVLRQPFGRCSLLAEVAGGGSKEQNYVTLLFPLLRSGELSGFLTSILPEYQLPSSMVSLPRRACRRYIFRAVVPMLLVIVPLQWVPYGWLSFALFIPAFFWGLSRYHAGGTALNDRQLTFRFRFINRFRVLMLRNCVQSMQVSANPFQRWWKLRTVYASVLSSPAGKTFQVTDVDISEAERLWKWYSRYR